MSEKLPERADIRQLRIQAKELLRTLPSTESATPKLADAQLLIARKYGFNSWPKLVVAVETPVQIEKFKQAILDGDAKGLEKLLKTKPVLHKLLNEPMFEFDTQPLLRAARHPQAEQLLPILVWYGADPNIRSKWWAGGFSALDFAEGKTVDMLLELGASFDVWSAAAQGRVEELRLLLDADPARVNAAGGDGQRPLHVAKTVEVAELLIQRGADLEIRDTDHESTPIQYQINSPSVVRVLLQHGAKPDIFTAVVLDDVDLLRQILRDDPAARDAHVGHPPFSTIKSNGGHIYAYTLGSTKSPLQVAAERGSRAVLEELQVNLSLPQRLVAASWLGDAATVEEILRQDPNIGAKMGDDARAITEAAQAGKTETVRLLLQAGLDPLTTGLDSGTALHVACWYGYADVVRLLVDRVPLDLLDSVHGSPPLGWAAHGSHWCRNKTGDYVAAVEVLLRAGADPNAPANSQGVSMLKQAGTRQDVKDVLMQFGAK